MYKINKKKKNKMQNNVCKLKVIYLMMYKNKHSVEVLSSSNHKRHIF
jgi:hypothetical protein